MCLASVLHVFLFLCSGRLSTWTGWSPSPPPRQPGWLEKTFNMLFGHLSLFGAPSHSHVIGNAQEPPLSHTHTLSLVLRQRRWCSLQILPVYLCSYFLTFTCLTLRASCYRSKLWHRSSPLFTDQTVQGCAAVGGAPVGHQSQIWTLKV